MTDQGAQLLNGFDDLLRIFHEGEKGGDVELLGTESEKFGVQAGNHKPVSYDGRTCGILGFFVVLRRLAFIGVGISHSAIGGVAIGILAGWNPLVTGAFFGVAVALGIALVSRSNTISEDTVIGVFFSGSMALGVVLFSLERGYQQDLFAYLFGNVLAISPGELAALGAIGLGIVLTMAAVFRSLLFVSFDEEIARDFILFGRPDVTVVVVDATRLERNLNLVLQVLEITDRVVVALNLMDESRRHKLRIDDRRFQGGDPGRSLRRIRLHLVRVLPDRQGGARPGRGQGGS